MKKHNSIYSLVCLACMFCFSCTETRDCHYAGFVYMVNTQKLPNPGQLQILVYQGGFRVVPSVYKASDPGQIRQTIAGNYYQFELLPSVFEEVKSDAEIDLAITGGTGNADTLFIDQIKWERKTEKCRWGFYNASCDGNCPNWPKQARLNNDSLFVPNRLEQVAWYLQLD